MLAWLCDREMSETPEEVPEPRGGVAAAIMTDSSIVAAEVPPMPSRAVLEGGRVLYECLFWDAVELRAYTILDRAIVVSGKDSTGSDGDTLVVHLRALRMKVRVNYPRPLDSKHQKQRICITLAAAVVAVREYRSYTTSLAIELLATVFEVGCACARAMTWAEPGSHMHDCLDPESSTFWKHAIPNGSSYAIQTWIDICVYVFSGNESGDVVTLSNVMELIFQVSICVAECGFAGVSPETCGTLYRVMPMIGSSVPLGTISVAAILGLAALQFEARKQTQPWQTFALRNRLIDWTKSSDTMWRVERNHLEMAATIGWWCRRSAGARRLCVQWMCTFRKLRPSPLLDMAAVILYATSRDPDDRVQRWAGTGREVAPVREMFILPDLPLPSSVLAFLVCMRRWQDRSGLPPEVQDIILQYTCCPPYNGNPRTVQQQACCLLLQYIRENITAAPTPGLKCHYCFEAYFVAITSNYRVTNFVP